MNPLTSTTDKTSFGKIITFENGRQCVIYFDHREDNPTLQVVMNSYGMVSSTKMDLGGDHTTELKKKALSMLLDLFDDKKALEIMDLLDQTVKKNIIDAFFPGKPQSFDGFAKISRNKGQVDLILVKDFKDDAQNNRTYNIKEITPATVVIKEYKSQEERDLEFDARGVSFSHKPHMGRTIKP